MEKYIPSPGKEDLMIVRSYILFLDLNEYNEAIP
jgi:hypothetical protein